MKKKKKEKEKKTKGAAYIKCKTPPARHHGWGKRLQLPRGAQCSGFDLVGEGRGEPSPETRGASCSRGCWGLFAPSHIRGPPWLSGCHSRAGGLCLRTRHQPAITPKLFLSLPPAQIHVPQPGGNGVGVGMLIVPNPGVSWCWSPG